MTDSADAQPHEQSDVPAAVRHSALDDVVGLATGVLAASLGVALLAHGGVVTGGTAGLALLLSYALPLPFGVFYVGVNLPFLVLGVAKKGWSFTLRTIACVTALAFLAPVHAWALQGLELDPVYAAVLGNLLAGVGLLILFRHSASLGGFNILALLAQERLGWRAGAVQLCLDALVVLGALLVVAPWLVLVSAIGAVVLNGVLVMNHRPGRYTGY